jgi:hypothetical protein
MDWLNRPDDPDKRSKKMTAPVLRDAHGIPSSDNRKNKNKNETKLGETGRSDDTVQRKHHTRIIVVVVEFCLAVTNFLDLCCCFLCPASLVLVGMASKSRATPTSDRTVTVIVSFRRLSVGLARDGSFC